jgi:hypothetical protein
MRRFILLIGIIAVICSCSSQKTKSDDSSTTVTKSNTNGKFILGMYALQPPVGSEGHHTGSVTGIKTEILSAYNSGDPSGAKGVNCAIAYRHWNRVDYPNQDFIGYVKNYIASMYKLTGSKSGEAGIQVLTPALYSSFFADPAEKMPMNDTGIDRNLDSLLFLNFVYQILEHEINIVLAAVDNDTSRTTEILLNKDSRPLAGWYLDDEPMTRNHDIEVIQSMGRLIREAETEFYENNTIFNSYKSDLPGNLSLRRYIAFDSDDLHHYPKASRLEDGKNYNLNGRTIKFIDGHIYSVFGEGVYDVLMPDFYHRNVNFWDVIFNEINLDYSGLNYKKPDIMPIIRGQVTEWDDIDTQADFYEELFAKLLSKNIQGIWIYAWRDPNPKTMDVVETWTHPKVQLSKIVQSIK